MTFDEFLLVLMMILMFLTRAAVLHVVCTVCICPVGLIFKIWLKSNKFEGIKSPSKIDDISRILAEVDDVFDVPDWGWCP